MAVVGWIERQKATRQLKKLRRLLDEKPSAVKTEIERQIHETEVDLNYALYFPLDEDYIPLYPRRRLKEEEDDVDDVEGGRSGKRKRSSMEDEGTKNDDNKDRQGDNIDYDNDDVEKVRPPLWKEVERRMQMDTLVQLRNGQRSRLVSNNIGHLRPSPSSHDNDHHHRKLEPAQTRKRLQLISGKQQQQQQQRIKGVTDHRQIDAVQAANCPRRGKGPSKENPSETDDVSTRQSRKIGHGSAAAIDDNTEDEDDGDGGFFEAMN